jgi:hypothetical protein
VSAALRRETPASVISETYIFGAQAILATRDSNRF